MEQEKLIQNSLFEWTNTINKLLEEIEYTSDCGALREMINNTAMDQFQDQDAAFEFKKLSIDRIDNKLRNIVDKEQYYSTQGEEEINTEEFTSPEEEMIAMQKILDSGIDLQEVKEKVAKGEVYELPNFDNDHSQFLYFVSKMINHSHKPGYVNPGVNILHHSMMAAINGIIGVYSDHIKELTK